MALLILLTILKAVGWLILALLAILLAVALVVALSPFTYKINASVSGDEFVWRIRGRWLFGIAAYNFDTDGGWFSVLGWRPGRRRKRLRVSTRKDEPDAELERESAGDTEPDEVPKPPSSVGKGRRRKRAPAGKDKSGGILAQLKQALSHPDRDEIIRHSKTLAIRLLRVVKPGRFRLEGVIGLDDPAETAWLLGGIYAVCSIVRLNAAIEGDFEKPAMNLEVYMQGWTTLWSLLWPIAVYIFKKPIWKIVRKILFGKDERNERRAAKKPGSAV